MADGDRDAQDDEQHRTTVNLVGVVVALIVVIAGVWLLISLKDAVKSEECLLFGLRQCARIQTPAR